MWMLQYVCPAKRHLTQSIRSSLMITEFVALQLLSYKDLRYSPITQSIKIYEDRLLK